MMARTAQSARSAVPYRPLSYALALAFATPAALAQESDVRLQDVVVTATGFEQKITDAPASISVVSKEELARKPYTSLVDAVRELEGVDVGETTDKTGQRTISMRGMGSDYTLVLIDGKRQNNHGDIYPNNFGGNQFNHVPPLDAIERIEVIRGPASTLYGADALGGVINIITKKDAKEWTGSVTYGRTFQQESDFGDATTTDFSLRGPIKPGLLSMSVRGSLYDREASSPELSSTRAPDNSLFTPTLGFGGGGRTVDNTNKALGFSLHLTPTDNQRITFDYDASKQVYDNEPYDSNSFPLGTVDSIDTIWRANGSGTVQPRAGYAEEQEFTRNAWSLSHEGDWDFGTSFVALSYVETDNNGRTMPFSVAERALLQEMYDGTGAYAGLDEDERRAIAESTFLPRDKRTLQSNQYTLDGRLDIPLNGLAGDHLLVVGGQIIRGELKDDVFGLEAGSGGDLQKHRMWSLFIEDNWMPTDNFTLTAGVRHDEHDLFGSNVSPRLYGTYKVNPQWTVKGGISTGYKTPKTTDLYDGITGFGGQGTSPFAGNPDLKPEKSRNTEVAVYWDHPARHNFNVTLFHNDFKDKIMNGEATQSCEATGGVRPCVNLGDYTDLGYGSYRQKINVDKAVIKGIEVAGRWQIAERWALRGNYTYTDSEQKSGADKGMPLTQTAKHMLNTTVDWQARSDLNVYLTMEARTKRYRGKDDAGNPRYYKGYEIFHLGAVYQLTKNFTISGRINNLLDEDFTTYKVVSDGSGGWEEQFDYNNIDARRNFWVSANYRF
ncbi:MAG: TonB-dependent receptor [Pseudazoarcus pumilus]|nr:TonB-dependent receptor [Pseudazoarcus pumilus]